MSVVGEFRKFAMRGNVVDLAVGFTVGVAFTTVVKSLVSDLVMPPIGLIFGSTDWNDLFWVLREGELAPRPYATLAEAQAAGAVTMNYGVFISNVVALFIVALAMFIVVRMVNRVNAKLEEEFGQEKPAPSDPTEKKCPFCLSTVPYKATRCPACTSELSTAGTAS